MMSREESSEEEDKEIKILPWRAETIVNRICSQFYQKKESSRKTTTYRNQVNWVG